MRNMQLVIFITAFVLAMALLVPVQAQVVIAPAPNVTENYTYVPISGNVTFDPNNYNGVKSVTDLTIYARNPEGVDTKTNPAADGTFTMNVPGSGNYSILVMPSKLDYLNATTNATYSVYYPDGSTFVFNRNVTSAGLNDIAIPTKIVVTGRAMSVTPEPPSIPSSQPTPGFTLLAALLAVAGVVAALAYRKR